MAKNREEEQDKMQSTKAKAGNIIQLVVAIVFGLLFLAIVVFAVIRKFG